MEYKYEIQIKVPGLDWASFRDELNNLIYLYETYDSAVMQLEKLQNQYVGSTLRILEL